MTLRFNVEQIIKIFPRMRTYRGQDESRRTNILSLAE